MPSDFSARISRNTQLFLQQESGSCRVVDPWAGSYFIERLTHELAERALSRIQEVEELGGMTKAIETGLPKMRIEESSARTQARIDSGKQAIVGVNKYPPVKEEDIEILVVDNRAVGEAQIARLNELRKERNQKEVEEKLNALTKAAETGDGNLLALSVDAARAKASVGEISYAL